jgi:iron complex outermembrane receptor protein
MKHIIRPIVLAILTAGLAADARAQTRPPAPDLARATIEDLMNITVTSASRKEERAAGVAAAVYVITQDDIRRSGMTTVPDLLRLVPGVQVARLNANKWAVSVRGFNGLYSNKLLVLIDGRSIYNHLFSGVLWDTEDLVLEDIDRIEVIRGPGAAVWGANAVNGVINILTRTAADTKGALVQISTGTFEPAQVVARYGGSFGNIDYRVYSQATTLGASRLESGGSADDQWRRATAGVRTDWTNGPSALTLQGSVTRARANGLWINLDPAPVANRLAVLDTPSLMNGGAVLGRWTLTRAGGASLQVQGNVDVAHRDEPVGDYRRRTADVDVQYHTAVGSRHDLVAGGGYRRRYEQFAGRNGFSLSPEASSDDLVDVFAQDEIVLAGDRLHVTLGARVERDTQAGWGLQPTARATWALVPKRQYLWAATSRALRTPSLSNRGIRVDYPPVAGSGPLPVRVSAFGSSDVRTEVLSDVETGYRLDLASAATIAVTGFYGRYQHLATLEPLDPQVVSGPQGPYISVPIRFGSLLAGETKGLEVDAHWTPARRWRLDASYSVYRFTPRLDPASRDVAAARADGDASRHQWQVHSGVSLGRRAELDVAVFHVGPLVGLGVPGYTRADGRLDLPLTRRLTASVVGQNLFDPEHAEFRDSGGTVRQTLVPRSVRVQLAWRY